MVAAKVANSLGWRLINRAIPAEVARRLAVSLPDALAHDEWAEHGLARLFSRSAVWLVGIGGGPMAPETYQESLYKAETEEVIHGLAKGSGAVVIGRAAPFVLGPRPDTLHVRLDGPVDARIRQAMAALTLTEAEARRSQRETDAARKAYVRHFYGGDWADPRMYQLMIDSTALSVDCCADLVLVAAAERLSVRGTSLG